MGLKSICVPPRKIQEYPAQERAFRCEILSLIAFGTICLQI